MFATGRHPIQSIEHWVADRVHAVATAGRRAGHGVVSRLEGLLGSIHDRVFAKREYSPVWQFGIRDYGNSIAVRVDAPSFAAGEVDVNVRGRELVIHGCREIETKAKNSARDDLHFQEFYHCEPILFSVDGSQAQSFFSDGTLTVILPKRQPAEVMSRAATSDDRRRTSARVPRITNENRAALQARLPKWPGRRQERAAGSHDRSNAGRQSRGR